MLVVLGWQRRRTRTPKGIFLCQCQCARQSEQADCTQQTLHKPHTPERNHGKPKLGIPFLYHLYGHWKSTPVSSGPRHRPVRAPAIPQYREPPHRASRRRLDMSTRFFERHTLISRKVDSSDCSPANDNIAVMLTRSPIGSPESLSRRMARRMTSLRRAEKIKSCEMVLHRVRSHRHGLGCT